MAGIKLLVDTDIFIDYLKGIKAAKALFDSGTVEVYHSILTEKELLSKPGLRDSERRRILRLLKRCRSIKIDNDIAEKFSRLQNKYRNHPADAPDFIIAATAWSRNLPVLTRNTKHFEYITEIKLSPTYTTKHKP